MDAPEYYTVELYFADLYHQYPGLRVMDVRVEGQATAPLLDLVAEVGYQTAFRLTDETRVTDGLLTITAWGVTNQPLAGMR